MRFIVVGIIATGVWRVCGRLGAGNEVSLPLVALVGGGLGVRCALLDNRKDQIW
jgi:hypothetical protein